MKNVFGNNQNDIEKELSVGLLRQRRNLILISLIMPLFFLSGAAVNQINMFGTVIHLQSQSGINIVLFVIFFYFLWRYLQYYLEENRAKEFCFLRDNKIHQIEFDYFKELMFIKTKCLEFEHYYPCYKNEDKFNLNSTRILPDAAMDKKISTFKKSRAMEIYGLSNKYYKHYCQDKDKHIKLPSDEVELIEKEWRYVNKKQGDARSGAIFETDVKYHSLYLTWLKFKAKLKFYIVHPYFSDYKLPFLIAGVSLIISVTYASKI